MARFRRLRCRAHCYATENPSKVRKAVENVLGGPVHRFKTTKLEGHYGDTITVFEYELSDEERVAKLLRRVVEAVGPASVGVEEYGRGGRLHIRLSKQKALEGVLMQEDVDPVKLEFTYEGDWREVWREDT